VEAESVGDVFVTEFFREREGSHGVIVRAIHFGMIGEKKFHELFVAVFDGNEEWGDAVFGLGIDIGVMLKKQAGHVHEAFLGGDMERGGIHAIGEIHLRALL
jgi:hypothetical protein